MVSILRKSIDVKVLWIAMSLYMFNLSADILDSKLSHEK